MERKHFTIYRATAPDGRSYVGCTTQTLKERWRQHKMRAIHSPDYDHPLYNLIREIGADAFTLEALEGTFEESLAMELEIHHIANTPESLRLNVSRGGYYDEIDGSRIGWAHVNSTPEKRQAYIEKLSTIKKENDWTDYAKLTEKSLNWRHEHPKEAYRNSRRAIRIATKALTRKKKEPEPEDRKKQLMRRYNEHKARSIAAASGWARSSPEAIEERKQKIRDKAVQRMACLSEDERREITAKARAAIDRKKQGAAASAGLKRYWEDLRKDPERYKAVMDARREKRCAPTTS